MTDHFRNCKPGDTVTVTLRGKYVPSPVEDVRVWIGNWLGSPNSDSIISVTVEPRALAVGDRVRMGADPDNGRIVALGEKIAIVLWDQYGEGSVEIADLEWIND